MVISKAQIRSDFHSEQKKRIHVCYKTMCLSQQLQTRRQWI